MVGATPGVAVPGTLFVTYLSNAQHSPTGFMSGMHAAFAVGGLAELTGSGLAFAGVDRDLIGPDNFAKRE